MTSEEATTLLHLRCVWEKSFRVEFHDGLWIARALAEPVELLTANTGTELRELMQGKARE